MSTIRLTLRTASATRTVDLGNQTDSRPHQAADREILLPCEVKAMLSIGSCTPNR